MPESRLKATQYYYRAILALQQGEQEEARALLSYAHRLDPEDAQITYALAQRYEDKGQLDRAESLFEEAYRRDSLDRSIVMSYATILSKGNASRESKLKSSQLLEAWLRHSPNDEEAQNMLASAYFRASEYNKAIALYGKLKEENKSLFSEYLRLSLLRSRMYFATEQRDEALRELSELVTTFPHEANAKVRVIAALYGYDLYEQAEPYLRALQDEGQIPDGQMRMLYIPYYRAKGDSLSWEQTLKAMTEDTQTPALGKIEEWKTYLANKSVGDTLPENYNWVFERITKLHPEESEAILEYAKILELQGKHQASIELLRSLTKTAPELSDVWTHLLSQLVDQKDYTDIPSLSEQGLKHLPQEWRIAYMGVAPYIMQEQEEAARKYLERTIPKLEAVESEGFGLSLLYGTLGSLYEESNKKRCYEYYDKALAHYEGNTEVLNNYAYFLALEGKDLARAERMAQQALKIKKDNSNLLDTYAWILYLRGNYSFANLYIRKAISEAERSEEVNGTFFDHYGDILLAEGKVTEAIPMWQKGLKLYREELADKRKGKATKKAIKKLEGKIKRLNEQIKKHQAK